MTQLTIRDVYSTIVALGGAPALTWYSAEERIELSGTVLINWINKTTNLLVAECDSEPGEVVALNLPPHWKTLTWAMATWMTGAELIVAELQDNSDGQEVTTQVLSHSDVIVTNKPSKWTDAEEVIAVPLASLARSFGPDLPRGAIDAASAVMTYSDGLGYVQPIDPAAAALSCVPRIAGRGECTHADLVTLANSVLTGSERTLLLCEPTTPTSEVALAALGLWSQGGSLILADPVFSAQLDADPARLQRLVESERVETIHRLTAAAS